MSDFESDVVAVIEDMTSGDWVRFETAEYGVFDGVVDAVEHRADGEQVEVEYVVTVELVGESGEINAESGDVRVRWLVGGGVEGPVSVWYRCVDGDYVPVDVVLTGAEVVWVSPDECPECSGDVYLNWGYVKCASCHEVTGPKVP